MDALRVAFAGSVDDGKSTLVGRLLYDTGALLDDQLLALARGTDRLDIDFASLTDGLREEREQGVTIDVAYRYFRTSERAFILADCPGHTEFTRNAVTGMSTADVAVILVDVTKGISEQTLRHIAVAALLRVRSVVIAVNKMDLVDYSAESFARVEDAVSAAAERFGILDFAVIPTSGRQGVNVAGSGHDLQEMRWYEGESLLGHVANVQPEVPALGGFRMHVQGHEPHPTSELGWPAAMLAGSVSRGTVAAGDQLIASPGDVPVSVVSVHSAGGDRLDVGSPGAAVSLLVRSERPVVRGHLLAPPSDPPRQAMEIAATAVCMSALPLRTGMWADLKLGSGTHTGCRIEVEWCFDIADRSRSRSDHIRSNEIGGVLISLPTVVAYDAYNESKDQGAFLLIDQTSGATVGCGIIGNPFGAKQSGSDS